MVMSVTKGRTRAVVPRQLGVTGRTLTGVGAAAAGAGLVSLLAGVRSGNSNLTNIGAVGLIGGLPVMVVPNEGLLLPVTLGGVAGAAAGAAIVQSQGVSLLG